jgi:hypothetical protein
VQHNVKRFSLTATIPLQSRTTLEVCPATEPADTVDVTFEFAQLGSRFLPSGHVSEDRCVQLVNPALRPLRCRSKHSIPKNRSAASFIPPYREYSGVRIRSRPVRRTLKPSIIPQPFAAGKGLTLFPALLAQPRLHRESVIPRPWGIFTRFEEEILDSPSQSLP